MYLSDQIKCTFQIKLYDINNLAHNLTNANLSAFDNFVQIYHWPLLECAPILCIHAMLLVQDSKTQMYWSANSLIF